uniref:F-box domain-containing protein n=1 Tax=Leersia perrieri TaxID=77586 RepID=A0A0D9WX54_9ORYZ
MASGAPFGAVEGVLPPELLLEVMLRLPTKPICRLRAVCRSWMSFTMEPLFLEAYTARNPHPLLAVAVSGDVSISWTCPETRRWMGGGDHIVSLPDPATGFVSTLPFGIGEEIARRNGRGRLAWFAFGQTASTGEYKLLRVLQELQYGYEPDLVCDQVFTVSDVNVQWRKMVSPPGFLDPSCTNGVVLKGSAYFFLDHWLLDRYSYNISIPSFDFATEQWSMTLQGPINRILQETNSTLNYNELTDRLICVQPLLVTNEGKEILWVKTESGVVLVYNPVTNTSSEIVRTETSKWRKCKKKSSKTDNRTGLMAYLSI